MFLDGLQKSYDFHFIHIHSARRTLARGSSHHIVQASLPPLTSWRSLLPLSCAVAALLCLDPGLAFYVCAQELIARMLLHLLRKRKLIRERQFCNCIAEPSSVPHGKAWAIARA